MRTLKQLTVNNFKSIKSQSLDLGHLNVFIGGNGSGKSNLIGVFHFLNRIINGELQAHVGAVGGADSILHFGRRHSSSLSMSLRFEKGSIANGYDFTLMPTADDSFIFRNEAMWFQDLGQYKVPYDISLGSGQKEANIRTAKQPMAAYVRADLESYRIYHFHDTSSDAKVKQTGDLDDNRILKADAGNLAAFLFLLQERYPTHFANIQDTIKQIAPFFESLQLAPSALNPDKIRFEWKEKGSDTYFNAHALSDGTLRFICLATLLLQPNLPSLVLLDEPELGLHPAAITLLAALLESAAQRAQVLIATQSVTLVNQFTPEEVWVVDRDHGESNFEHLRENDLTSWLDGYALGELWEKNVLGGRP